MQAIRSFATWLDKIARAVPDAATVLQASA
jgi:hypothetical protein